MDVIREAICSQIKNLPCNSLTAYAGRKGEKKHLHCWLRL